jgi:hypothetical protein
MSPVFPRSDALVDLIDLLQELGREIESTTLPFQVIIITIAYSLTVPIMATPFKASCFSIKTVAQVDDKVKSEIDMLAELIA